MNTLVQVLIGFTSSGSLWAAALYMLSRKEKRRADEDARREQQREAQRQRDEVWFGEAAEAYKRVERECDSCNKRLTALSRRFYALIAALDNMCDDAAEGTVKVHDLRSAVRISRQTEDQ